MSEIPYTLYYFILLFPGSPPRVFNATIPACVLCITWPALALLQPYSSTQRETVSSPNILTHMTLINNIIKKKEKWQIIFLKNSEIASV